jgi:hypothetical protein
MSDKYKTIVSLIPVFADQKFSQLKPEYFKILTDKKDVLKKEVSIFHNDIKACLSQLYNEYLNIEYDWATKELINCRKKDGIIEITYICKMPYIDNCNKKGNIVNVNDFMSLITDEYYVAIITGTTPNCFK